MTMLAGLLGLFAIAFAAATLLPLQSEAVLVGMLLGTDIPVWLLVAVASLGNLLGSLVNWWIGGQIHRFRGRRWFPVSPAALAKAEGWYQRWGCWSLLLSWAPLLGDPLTVIAGMLREPLPVFLLLVGIAKTLRYVAVAAITLGLFG
jgi:membrane protein YqaA with SNARE-associated domain